MLTLAERIKLLRKLSCLTGQEFAALIGVSKAYISQLEKGSRTNLSADKIHILASNFKVNCEWISDGIGNPPVNFNPNSIVEHRGEKELDTAEKKNQKFPLEEHADDFIRKKDLVHVLRAAKDFVKSLEELLGK